MDYEEEESNIIVPQQNLNVINDQNTVANHSRANEELLERFSDEKILSRKDIKSKKEEKREAKRKRKKLLKKRAKLNEKMSLKMVIKDEKCSHSRIEDDPNFLTENVRIKKDHDTVLNETENEEIEEQYYNTEVLPKYKKYRKEEAHLSKETFVNETTDNTNEKELESSDENNCEKVNADIESDDEDYDQQGEGVLKDFVKQLVSNMKTKHDEVDKYFLVLASTIKKCNLSKLELTQLQCNLLTYLKDELIKMGKM
ncbi:interaptin-like [Condylostylus longicornis]|uniref:interaptin-like n=1 Tax=Condylostylus longicornis TaxID=2530218 RepID=UPI00244E235E|nr:interaptin-like [Condylostylus longicornis]